VAKLAHPQKGKPSGLLLRGQGRALKAVCELFNSGLLALGCVDATQRALGHPNRLDVVLGYKTRVSGKFDSYCYLSIFESVMIILIIMLQYKYI
jgi:hypothetical protein